MLLKTLIVATICVGIALAEQSPVFLWGANSVSKPALSTVPQQEFADIIAPLLKDYMVVAFQEEGLTTTDFNCESAETSCYAHLRGVSQKTYYASVENPAEALRSLTTERESNSIGQNGQLETPLTCTVGKVVLVKFDSAAGARENTLKAHDAAISSINNELSCPTVYLYMSAPSSSTGATVPRRMRRSTAAATNGYLFREKAQFLLYFSTLSLKTGSGLSAQTQEIIVSGSTVQNKTENLFSVSLATNAGGPLTFDIAQSGGYFNMSNVVYNGVKYYTPGINAPTDFSFFCGNLTLAPLSGSAPTSTLLWNSFQLQAPFGSTLDPNFVFGDSWDCVYFFTPGILSGLFVAILLLFITFTGICWMMDINTMDRFDDPKGKTITINAAE